MLMIRINIATEKMKMGNSDQLEINVAKKTPPRHHNQIHCL